MRMRYELSTVAMYIKPCTKETNSNLINVVHETPVCIISHRSIIGSASILVSTEVAYHFIYKQPMIMNTAYVI